MTCLHSVLPTKPDAEQTARYLDEYSKEKPVVGNDDAIDPEARHD